MRYIIYTKEKDGRRAVLRSVDSGVADLMPSLAIIIAALFMRQASEDLMLSEYVIGIIEPLVSARLFPMIAFITVRGLDL